MPKEREIDCVRREGNSMTILARTIEYFRANRIVYEGSGLIIELQTKQK